MFAENNGEICRNEVKKLVGWLTIELMHSWGFALREGVFAETKEGKCKNKREKS